MRTIRKAILLGVVVAVNTACGTSDPGVTAAVKAKLAADDLVKAYQIDVDTKDGVVTLKGTVPSNAARDRAIEVARFTDGVQRVEDGLTVSAATIDQRAEQEARDAAAKTEAAAGRVADAAAGAGAAVTDAGITAAVKTRLLADPGVAGLTIDVDTSNKVVTLSGTVRTSAQKTEAGVIARETSGVARVVNNLRVGR